MELLNMFDKIEISNDNRLVAEDAEKMNEFRNTLKEMRKEYTKYIEFYRENPVINYSTTKSFNKTTYHDFEEKFIEDIVFNQIKSLISSIYYYFKEKYGVKLNTLNQNTDYSPKYRKFEAEKNYKWFMEEDIIAIVIDDIFNQLEGFDFEDKAEQELKEEIQKYCYRDNLQVKGKNISIKSYVCFSWFKVDSRRYEFDYNNREKIEEVIKLISYYEKIDIDKVINNIKNISIETSNITGKVFELGNKATGLKIFKNGKIQITFSTGEKALQFAKKYLNYQG